MWWSCCVLMACTVPALSAAGAMLRQENAAMLYYQAFLLCPPHEAFDNGDAPDRDAFVAVMADGPFRTRLSVGGEALSWRLRHYLSRYGDVITLTESASRIGHCDWAMPDGPPGRELRVQLRDWLRSVAFLYGADIHGLLSDDAYDTALTRCMTLRRMAAHVAEDPGRQYWAPLLADEYAFRFMRQVLNQMPADRGTLLRMQADFGPVPSFVEALPDWIEAQFGQALTTAHSDGELLASLREELAEAAADSETRSEALEHTDEQLMAMIRESCSPFVDDIIATLNSGASYGQVYASLGAQAEAVRQAGVANPLILVDVQTLPQLAQGFHLMKTSYMAYHNAVANAIELHLIRERAGRLPRSLPEGLLKDPFSGADFEYEAIQTGFLFRCPTTPAGREEPSEYRFAVETREWVMYEDR